MNPFDTQLMLPLMAALGALISGVAFAVFGGEVSAGAVAGTALGIANFLAVRFVATRIVRGSNSQRLGMGFLLVLKMGAAMALCYLLIVRFGLHAGGFALGFSSFVLALVFAPGVAALRAAPEAPEEC